MPIQGRKRATGMSVLSAQERTKSTSWSRVSWGTQQPFRVPQDSFFSSVCASMSSAMTSFLRCELGFELLDLLVLGVFDGLGLAAVVEGEVAVLEELLEPVVELVGVDVEFIAQVGDGDLVDEVPFEDGDLLGAGEMTTRLVHGETSVQVMLTRTERFPDSTEAKQSERGTRSSFSWATASSR